MPVPTWEEFPLTNFRGVSSGAPWIDLRDGNHGVSDGGGLGTAKTSSGRGFPVPKCSAWEVYCLAEGVMCCTDTHILEWTSAQSTGGED